MTKPTNEEIIADMLAVYQELGYLTYCGYTTYGLYNSHMARRRFGTWEHACHVANIPTTRKSSKVVAMTTTRCLSCDEWFDRPKDDKSCRRCKVCKRNLVWKQEAIGEGWEMVAAL